MRLGRKRSNAPVPVRKKVRSMCTEITSFCDFCTGQEQRSFVSCLNFAQFLLAWPSIYIRCDIFGISHQFLTQSSWIRCRSRTHVTPPFCVVPSPRCDATKNILQCHTPTHVIVLWLVLKQLPCPNTNPPFRILASALVHPAAEGDTVRDATVATRGHALDRQKKGRPYFRGAAGLHCGAQDGVGPR